MVPFRDVVRSADELRDLLGKPSALVARKELPALDPHCRMLIARSPFLVLATSDAHGGCDVSPRGDAPGFVEVLDDRTLVIPERSGNRRIDSLRNIVANPAVGMLFVVPGMAETLRVNGRAWVVRDPDLLDRLGAYGKTPQLAIGVEVQEAFLHCARAFLRARLWQPDTWPDRGDLPTLGTMMRDQLALSDSAADLDRRLARSNSDLS